MAQVKNIDLDVTSSRDFGNPTAKISFNVEFTKREVEENYEYQVRAWLFEQDHNRDEIVFYPNGYSISMAFAADWPSHVSNKDDLNEGQGYFGRDIIRPKDDAGEDRLYTATFERSFDASDTKDTGDSYGDDEEYYAAVVVTPEIHTAVAFTGGTVNVDTDPVLL